MFDLIDFRKALLESNVRWHIEYTESCVSTSEELNRRFCNKNEAPWLVLVAEEQTCGRGRLNRRWQSVPGKDITASVIFPCPVDRSDAPKLSLCAGLALISVLQRDLGIKCQARWPNDVVTENGKLAGILCAYLSQPNAVICGIGINVNSCAGDVELGPFGNRTTILDEIGEEIPMSSLLSSWILEFESKWPLASSINHDELAEQFNSVSFYMGKKVKVLPGAGNYLEEDKELKPTGDEIYGVAGGISRNGSLLVVTAPSVHYEVGLEDVIRPIE